MSESVELARPRRSWLVWVRGVGPNSLRNIGQELRLSAELICSQAGFFSGFLNLREIYRGGEVLLSGTCQKVCPQAMLIVRAQRAFRSFWRKELLGGQTVVDGQ